MKKLDSTIQLLPESVLRVYKKGFGYSILRVVTTHDLFLAARCPQDFLAALNNGDRLEAYFWVNDIASYEFSLEVIGSISKPPCVVFFANTDRFHKTDERKCLGAPTMLPINYFIFTPGEAGRAFSSEKVVFHQGHIIWLEDRESILKTDIEIQDDVFVRGHINIEDEDTEIVGKISVLNKDKFIYNILYTGVTEQDRSRILDYIFNTYRE